MMKIVFATNNQHKLKELQQILSMKFELLSLDDMKCFEEIPETSSTIEGNSMQKAEYVYNKFKMDCFADDTGLEIEALDGRPGVNSARYAGDERDMDKNIEKVFSELENANNRNARFKTVISLFLNGKKHQFEGIVNGKIIKDKKGQSGFGYDPVFVPNGYDITFAEMDAELKNKISHRGIAVQKLLRFLTKNDSPD
ncbi:MAG: non-canonical purine NTP pyrophosphatase [Bacteroidetes bacterium]|nr:MAG: non-canonical purine NTP pyrophosphatase [Bacteroidota bacterium]